jgi:hypothetical protein
VGHAGAIAQNLDRAAHGGRETQLGRRQAPPELGIARSGEVRRRYAGGPADVFEIALAAQRRQERLPLDRHSYLSLLNRQPSTVNR